MFPVFVGDNLDYCEGCVPYLFMFAISICNQSFLCSHHRQSNVECGSWRSNLKSDEQRQQQPAAGRIIT